MFSIIVPVYNAEKTLSSCINSILFQECNDYEVILVDDGSTDSSGFLCDEYSCKDKRVKVLHKENGGVSSARNAGLLIATGEWVVFVDSDDTLEKGWLSVYENHIDSVASDILLVQRANMINGLEVKEILHSSLCGLQEKDCFYLNDKFGYLWNKCFSREIIDNAKIVFDENMRCFEDEIFILEYSQHIHSFYIIDSTPQYNYYLPDFHSKYRRDSTFTKQYYRYCRTKLLSQTASIIAVDWLVMTMLQECANDIFKVKKYALLVKEAVGKDIKYALGLKKILLRSVSILNFNSWWILMVWIYSLLYKMGLLK